MVRGTLSRLRDAEGHLFITMSPKFLHANHTDRVPILDIYMYHAAREMLFTHVGIKRHTHVIITYRHSTHI